MNTLDAQLAAQLFAIDPAGLGGIVLRSAPGVHRDRFCGWVRACLGGPVVRLPLGISDDRLLGGLSLVATLESGRPMFERGLLASADGGVVIVAMAERIEPRVTTALASALDHGALAVERDGMSETYPCRLGVLALDEGVDGEHVPAALRDRLALYIDLEALDPVECDPARVLRARAMLRHVALSSEVIEALCSASVALGVASVRAPLAAARVARAHAALEGRRAVIEADAVVAARLVLGPLATQMPANEEQEEQEEEPREPEEEKGGEREESSSPQDGPLEDVVLAAAASAIPKGLLEELAVGRARHAASAGRAGALSAALRGGRPAGTRMGVPRNGERLDVIATLRAAAPWQRIRTRHAGRIAVRKDDFRITRFEQRNETRVIFAVDASGSAALQRLAEAKGAVEQVLGDCYTRRDHVALVAFRGRDAQLLLPPTRSLARVRRSLAGLAGGGTTPVAAGLDAALRLAIDARRCGQTPVMVVMTDGRANIGHAGREGSAAANEDAHESARAVRAAAIPTLFLDTSPRPRPHARDLAAAMGARYLPLPHVDARGISRAVQSLAGGA